MRTKLQEFAGLLAFASLIVESGLAKERPAEKSEKPMIEVCFVLDTTGSMSGLIEGAKQKIWSIARKQQARAELQTRIQKLNQEREDYLARERKRLAEKGKSDSFDDKVAQIIRDQAA